MIGTLDVKINAAHPNLPLTPFYTFVSSPSSVRVTNVPKKIGSWEISKVFVTANYPDNTSRSAECVNVAGCYVATLPACNVVGESVNGFQITANGVDENGNAVTGYVLGHGDLIVLTRAGNITVGTTTWYFNFKDTQPTAPVKGDACIINGNLKWYNGTAWVDFGGFNLSGVTLDLNADQATINEKLGEVIRRAGGTVIGCLAALLALSGMAAHEYPTNPDPSHKEFFGKMTRDSLVLTNAPEVVEIDPTVPAWAKAANPPAENDPNVLSFCKNLALYNANFSLNLLGIDPVSYWHVAMASNTYTKTEADSTFAAKESTYTKTEADSIFSAKASTYTKSEANTKFIAKDVRYQTIKTTSPTTMPIFRLEHENGDDYSDINIYPQGIEFEFQDGDDYHTFNIYNHSMLGIGFVVDDVMFGFPSKSPGPYTFATTDDVVTEGQIGTIATNVVRSANGGLWDASLGVWWTPVMSNGKLTYQATTNVNLNAGN